MLNAAPTSTDLLQLNSALAGVARRRATARGQRMADAVDQLLIEIGMPDIAQQLQHLRDLDAQ